MHRYKATPKSDKDSLWLQTARLLKGSRVLVVLAGLIFSWHIFSVATAAPSTNIVYSSDGGATWSSTLTVKSGQEILTRLYFDNDNESNVTDAQMNTALPAGSTLVPGTTRTCLNPGTTDPTSPTTEMACNDSAGMGGAIDEGAVWSGDTLNIAPNAGVYGEATNATSGLMAAGKKKYLNLQQCMYRNSGNLDWITVAIDDPPATGWHSDTKASNTADGAVACGPGSHSWTTNSGLSSVKNLSLLGKRYVNLHQCNWYYSDPDNGTRRITNLIDTLSSSAWSAGTNTSNAADSAVNCSGGSSWTLHSTISDVQALDVSQNRYINLHQCLRTHPTSNQYLTTFIDDVPASQWNTGTNASNTPDTALVCPTVWDPHNTLSDFQVIDLLDTNRGQGFVEYEMVAPSVTETQTYDQDATLTGTGTGDPTSSGSLTVEPDLKLIYSTDGGSTWTTDPAVDSGANVLVRVFSHNKRELTLNSTQFATTLPTGFSLVSGSTKTCLNPGTIDATNPATETLCNDDAGQGGSIDEGAVWAGQDLTISTTAGLFGQATNLISGYLAAGKKKYTNLHQCVRHTDPAYDWITVAVDDPPAGSWYAGTNASNTTDGAVDCGAASWTTHDNTSDVQNLDLFGERYFNLHNCTAYLSDSAHGNRFLTTLSADPPAAQWGTGTNTANTADSTIDCPAPGGWTVHGARSGVQPFDVLENRYINLHECVRVASSPSRYVSTFTANTSSTAWRTGTNASNTPDTSLDCPVVNSSWTNHGTLSDFQVLDLLDMNRGQVFAEFEVTAPSPQAQTEYTHNAALTGAGTGDQSAEDTITVLVDPGVIITQTGGSTDVTEGGASDTVYAQLTAPPTDNVTLTFTDDNSQLATIPPVTFTPSDWDTPQPVGIVAVDDHIIEGPHTDNLNYTASSSDTGFDGLSGDDVVTVNITDNDAPGGTVIVNDDLTSEDGDTGEFCITLLTEPSDDVTIALSSSDTNEVSVPPSVTILAANWDSTSANCVTVTGVDDGPVADGLQAVTITTGNVTSNDANYNALDGSTIDDATIYNQNNDPPGFAVDVIDSTTTEDGGTATVQFRLLSQPDGGADVTIPLSIDDPSEGTLSGVTSITIANADWDNGAANQATITGVDDDLTDGNVTYHLVTGDPTSSDPVYDAFTGADIVDPLLTNIDTDVAGVTVTETGGSTDVIEGGATDTVQVVLDTRPAPGNIVVVTVQPQPQLDVGAGPDTAIQLTFDNSNWDTPQPVTVSARDDNKLEGDHSALLSYSINTGTTTEPSYKSVTGIPATTVNITDDDTATASITKLDDAAENPANNGHFRVTLSEQNSTGGPITVNYIVSGTATAGSDYVPLSGSVAIPNGASSANITVDVAGMDDNLLEGMRTVIVTLDSTDNTQVTIGATDQATVEVLDDEVQTASASLQVAQNGNEDGPTDVIYEVVLTNQNETGSPITFSINPAGGSASSGTDYVDFSGQTISIPNGASSGTHSVTVIDDNLAEGPETVRATIGNPSLVGLAISSTHAVATIADNDTADATITATDDSATENSSDGGEFTINLSAPNNSPDDLVITYSISGSATAGSDYAPLSGTVEIPIGADSATIAVTTNGYDDPDFEGFESVIITLTDTDNSSFILGAPATAMVAIADTDSPSQPEPQQQEEPAPIENEQPLQEDEPIDFFYFIERSQPETQVPEKFEIIIEEEPSQQRIDSDGDGIDNEEEDKALNNGDGNGDGIPDKEQPDVTSIISSATNKPVTLAASGNCQKIHGFDVMLDINDSEYAYPQGLFNYEVSCLESGQNAQVTIYIDSPSHQGWMWRKYNRFDQTYATFNDKVQFNKVPIGNSEVVAITYKITDGGDLDEDGIANGIILDPSGPGIRDSSSHWIWWLFITIPILIILLIIYRKRYSKSAEQNVL